MMAPITRNAYSVGYPLHSQFVESVSRLRYLFSPAHAPLQAIPIGVLISASVFLSA